MLESKDVLKLVLFGGIFILVPVIYMLTRLQMRMTTLIHGRSNLEGVDQRIQNLEAHVLDLHEELRKTRLALQDQSVKSSPSVAENLTDITKTS